MIAAFIVSLLIRYTSPLVLTRYIRGPSEFWTERIWTTSQKFSSISRNGARPQTKLVYLNDCVVCCSCLTIPIEIAKLDDKLAPWTHHDSPGKKRADSDDDSFSVK